MQLTRFGAHIALSLLIFRTAEKNGMSQRKINRRYMREDEHDWVWVRHARRLCICIQRIVRFACCPMMVAVTPKIEHHHIQRFGITIPRVPERHSFILVGTDFLPGYPVMSD